MGTVVELPWRRNNLSGDSNSKTLKMPKMIFQVLILVSGWAAQTLEGSPTAGLDLQENLQENQIGTQHLTPELLRNLQVNKAEMSQMWSGLERSRETVAKVEARLEELWQRVDALGPTIDTKLERLMEDLMERIEVKEKRSLQSTENFATAEQMDQVMKVFQELRDLPRNVSSMMSAAKQEMSQSLSQAVSRDELGKFRLAVARNTALLRFDEGEWVDIQARGQFGNGPDFFARDMAVYVNGFGDPSAEFWLGLDKLKQLTREGAQLRVELETFDGEIVQAAYSNFRVEGSDYRLTVGGFSGNAGDTLRIDNGMAFSARDNDQDRWSGNCSSTRGNGGWWFNGCGLANLNGLNLPSGATGYEGILWYFYAKDNRSFKSSRMMISRN